MRNKKNKHADENGVTEVSTIEIEQTIEEGGGEGNSPNDDSTAAFVSDNSAIADATTNNTSDMVDSTAAFASGNSAIADATTGPTNTSDMVDSTAAFTSGNSAIADATTGPNGSSPLRTTGPNGSASAHRPREAITTNVIDTELQDHPCVQNYDGSSGGMESDGLLLLIKKLKERTNGEVYLDYIVTDDDTKMKKYITHAQYKERGWKNHGGSLPSDIPEPNWFADPTHRAKCVAGAFFEMTKGAKTDIRATKLDALRMKKYYSYFIKQNCTKEMEWLLEHAMAPLDHLFDNHHLCDSTWCHKKKVVNEKLPVDPKEERNNKTYYRSMKDDEKLYHAMKAKYEKYIDKEYLQHCRHSFDTQVNKGMNNSVAAYAAKGKNYAGTSSLLTRVHVAAGVQLVGYHHFWTSVLDSLQVDIPHQLHLKFLAMDREKVVRFHRDHEFKSKAKRKRLEHNKLNALYVEYQKDVARNAVYKSQTGCNGTPTAKKTKTNTCLHAKFGCDGKKNHRTERSKHCAYHKDKLGGLSLDEAQQKWLKENGNKSGKYKKTFFFSNQNPLQNI